MPAALRLTVLVDGERHDVSVPAGVRVTELVPELTRRRGHAAASPSAGADTLVRADGTAVEPGRCLDEQVRDGDVLTLVPVADLGLRDVVDDPVEAVRSVLEADASAAAATRAVGLVLGGAAVPWSSLLRAGLVLVAGLVLAAAVLAGPAPGRAADGSSVGTGSSVGVQGVVGALGVAVVVLAGLVALGGAVLLRRAGDRTAGSVAHGSAAHGSAVVGAAGLASAGVVASAALLRGAGLGPGAAARAGLVLLVLAGVVLTAGRRRRGPAATLALPGTLLLLGAGVLAVSPLSAPQVAAVLGAAVVVLARAAPWVAATAGRLDRATEVRRAGETVPDSPGGVDLQLAALALGRARASTRSAVLGLGLTVVCLAPVVVLGGEQGVLVAGWLGLLLVLQGRAGADPVLRRVHDACAALVLVGAATTSLVVLPGAATLVVALAASALLGGLLSALLGALRSAPLASPGGPPRGRHQGPREARAGAGRMTTALESVLLLGLLPLLALDLGLLPTPWGAG